MKKIILTILLLMSGIISVNAQNSLPDDNTPILAEVALFEKAAPDFFLHKFNFLIQIEYRNIEQDGRIDRTPVAVGFFENDKFYGFETLCPVWSIPAILASKYPNQEQRNFLNACKDKGCVFVVSLSKDIFLVR